MQHESQCEGGHTADMSCAEVAEWRVHELANPWHCWYGRNGYHRFSKDPAERMPDAQCEHAGCARRWGELRSEIFMRRHRCTT